MMHGAHSDKLTVDQHRIINMSQSLCYSSHKLYYDRSVTTDRTVRSNRPDAVMPDRTLQETFFVV